jgi:retron-type reverse transcriptase
MKVSIDALELAWRRVKADQRRGREQRRVFVRQPHEIDLVAIDLQSYLDRLRERLASGSYQPSPQIICEAPKSPIAMRPGSILTLDDRVVFTAAVGSILPNLIDRFSTTDGIIDFSYWPAPQCPSVYR